MNASTLTDTAWALDALIAAEDQPTEAIQKEFITWSIQSIKRIGQQPIQKGRPWQEASTSIIIAIGIFFPLWHWLIIILSLDEALIPLALG